ncbi:Heme exporter protein D [Sphingomonas antarctica]
MNQWAFVWAAYALTLGGTAVLVVWAWTAMRRAEGE